MNWIQVLNGLLTPLIALIAIYIAYQQYKTARNKLKLELYEKRYKFYNDMRKFIIRLNSQPDRVFEELSEISYSLNEGRFLFDNDLLDYIEDLKKKAYEYGFMNAKITKISNR